jgi:hypothetical protein
VAESYLDMIFRTKKEGNANKEVAGELGDINAKGKSAASAFEMLTGSSLSAAGAFGAVAGALKFSIGAAMEAESIQADLNATITSTKGAAGMSAEAINNLAASLSEMSGIEDDSIVKAQAMMLTFTNIGKEVFPMASEAMVNMASKFGSVDAAAMQLGKALNDPIAGVGALRKVGVQLTDQQEASIKSFMALGDVASAQKVILGELQTEFGGLAAAMGSTTEGKINRLKNSLGNLAETVGGTLTPALGDAADALNLLLTASDKIKAATQDHSAEVAKTSKTYAEYAREMIRVDLVKKGAASTDEVVSERMRRLQGDLSGTIKSYGFLSRAEWEAAQGADVLTERITSQRPVILENKLSIEDSVKTYAALRTALSDTTPTVEEQERAMNDATTATGNNTTAVALNAAGVDNLAKSYGSLTTAEMFNTLAAGLNKEEAIKLGIQMGILDPKVMAAKEAMRELNANMDPKYPERYRSQAVELQAAIDHLSGKTIVITTYYNTVHQELTPEQAAATNPQNPGGPGATGTTPWTPSPGETPWTPGWTPPTPSTPYTPGWTPTSGDSMAGDSMTGRGGGITIGTVVLANSMDMETFKRMLVEAMGH